MARHLVLLVLGLWLLPGSPCQAAEDQALTELITAIQEQSKSIHSVTCDMVQEKHLALFDNPILFRGRLALVPPKKLRWEFTAPVPSALLLNGDTGTRCNDDAPPMHFDLQSDPVMRMVAEQLWTWLSSDYTRVGELYAISLHSPDTLLITPKEDSLAKTIARITIRFHRENMQPEQVEIHEPGGDFTRITFSGYQLNTDIDHALFSDCTSH